VIDMMRRMTVLLVFVLGLSAAAVPAQEKAASHVILLGTIKVKAGREEDFLKVLTSMNERMHREDHGNVRFEFYRAAPGRGQQTDAASTWYEYEEWVDQDASAAHAKWAGPILQTTWREMTESYSFARLTPVDFK
jgi:quinol monooxygenase YgiN